MSNLTDVRLVEEPFEEPIIVRRQGAADQRNILQPRHIGSVLALQFTAEEIEELAKAAELPDGGIAVLDMDLRVKAAKAGIAYRSSGRLRPRAYAHFHKTAPNGQFGTARGRAIIVSGVS